MKFDAKKVTNEIIDFIKDYYQRNNLTGAVIGISGGKDSAVCLALMVKAIGSENIKAIWLPANSKESDKNDAIELTKKFNVSLLEFDLTKYNNDFINDLKMTNNVSSDDLVNVNINIKPRLRMLTLYAYAAMFSSLTKGNYIVIGTSNKSERFVGYFTKGGDNISDIAPILDLYVDEVIKIGEYLEVPDNIIHKAPDDGLSGLTDEEKMGFSYDDVKKVCIELETNAHDDSISDEIRNKIMKAHNANMHKYSVPYYQRNNI